LAPDAVPVQNISQVVAQSVQPMLDRMKASRRDSELCRQILLTLRFLLPGGRRGRRHVRLESRPFYRDALWLAANVAKAEGTELPAELVTAVGDTPADAATDEELPAELLVDADGEGGRDRRGRRDRRDRGRHGEPANNVTHHEPALATEHVPHREERGTAVWEPGPRVRTPIPSLDEVRPLARNRPAFLGTGAFGRWAARAE
jgi:hypothetical protein